MGLVMSGGNFWLRREVRVASLSECMRLYFSRVITRVDICVKRWDMCGRKECWGEKRVGIRDLDSVRG